MSYTIIISIDYFYFNQTLNFPTTNNWWFVASCIYNLG